METRLKVVMFDSLTELVDYVNKKQITKENIQSIICANYVYSLFYWEITV